MNSIYLKKDKGEMFMEIVEIVEAVYKDLLDINKVAPYILGAFLSIAFVVRSVYAYKYSLNFQEKFGIPHYRFNKAFNNNIVEILCYIVLLLLFIVAQYVFAVNMFQIDDNMAAVCCAIFILGYNIIVLIPFVKRMTMRYVWATSIGITVLVVTAIVIYSIYTPFAKENYSVIDTCLMLYSAVVLILYFVYLLASYSYCIYKHFGANLNPKSDNYEIVTINDNKYAIVLNAKDEIILAKLKEEEGKLRVVKSDYLIAKSIENKNIEYKNVEL